MNPVTKLLLSLAGCILLCFLFPVLALFVVPSLLWTLGPAALRLYRLHRSEVILRRARPRPRPRPLALPSPRR